MRLSIAEIALALPVAAFAMVGPRAGLLPAQPQWHVWPAVLFESDEDGSSVSFGPVAGSPPPCGLRYTVDGQLWRAYSPGTAVALGRGERVAFRASGASQSPGGPSGRNGFSVTGRVRASGDVRSLCSQLATNVTSLGDYALASLFTNCTGLVTAPSVPLSSVGEGCCEFMFAGCTSLEHAPDLPATLLDLSCYRGMFLGCSSLRRAPKLSADWLYPDCYARMFEGCSSLTRPPRLRAEFVEPRCYDGMFRGCTSLVRAPHLPATALADSCYRDMFSGCTSLRRVSIGNSAHTWPAWPDDATHPFDGFTDGVPGGSAGLLRCTDLRNEMLRIGDIPAGWSASRVAYPGFQVTRRGDSALGVRTQWCESTGVAADDPQVSLERSLDGGVTWTAHPASAAVELPYVGACVCFRAGPGGNRRTCFKRAVSQTSYVMRYLRIGDFSDYWGDETDGLELSGNLESLLSADFEDLDGQLDSCVFRRLFCGCESQTSGYFSATRTIGTAAYLDLPVADVPCEGYYEMFRDCFNLIAVPAEIPSESIGPSGCALMFRGCHRIAASPVIRASTLSTSCLAAMFRECSSLASVRLGGDAAIGANAVRTVFGSGTGYWLGGDVRPGGTLYTRRDVYHTAYPTSWTVAPP